MYAAMYYISLCYKINLTLSDDFNNCCFLHFVNLSLISLDTYVCYYIHTCIILLHKLKGLIVLITVRNSKGFKFNNKAGL